MSPCSFVGDAPRSHRRWYGRTSHRAGLDFGCDSFRGPSRPTVSSRLRQGGDGRFVGDPEPFGDVNDGCAVTHLGDGLQTDLHRNTGGDGDIGFERLRSPSTARFVLSSAIRCSSASRGFGNSRTLSDRSHRWDCTSGHRYACPRRLRHSPQLQHAQWPRQNTRPRDQRCFPLSFGALDHPGCVGETIPT